AHPPHPRRRDARPEGQRNGGPGDDHRGLAGRSGHHTAPRGGTTEGPTRRRHLLDPPATREAVEGGHVITSLKIIAATLVVVGIVVGFLELRYAPHRLLLQSSPDRPWWLPERIGWLLTSVTAILYIVLDYMASH